MKTDISDERKAFLKKDFERGFIRFCRFKAVDASRGRFESSVEITDIHRQQNGFIHAGVMATLADHTAGYAAFTTAPEGFQILTVEFKINFLKPAFGEKLICRSKVIREGRQILVAESEVFDIRKQGEIMVAKAMVTLMAVSQEAISKSKSDSK